MKKLILLFTILPIIGSAQSLPKKNREDINYQYGISRISPNKDTLYLLRCDVGLVIAHLWAAASVPKKPTIVFEDEKWFEKKQK